MGKAERGGASKKKKKNNFEVKKGEKHVTLIRMEKTACGR